MRLLPISLAALALLGLGFAAGQWSPPYLPKFPWCRLPPPRDDPSQLLERCDAQIRALRTEHQQALGERRLLEEQRELCARWADAASVAQLRRIDQLTEALDERLRVLARELAEFEPLAAQLRDLQHGLAPAPHRGDLLDAARLRLRLAQLDAPPR